MISSQKDSFFKAYKEGKNFIPITQTWPADLETPLSTWLKLSSKDSHGVFPEKVNEGREKVGHNPRRIGENPNPAGLKFTTKNTFD